eukprot:1381378-Amorphochlora_amoeboformis.AAC.1
MITTMYAVTHDRIRDISNGGRRERIGGQDQLHMNIEESRKEKARITNRDAGKHPCEPPHPNS